jgi:carbonic anhydrase/acetyltransferase-like protein (isoleucine patch superfamily)
MPLYTLDDISPSVPADGRYWVAPDAHVVGRVTLGEDANIWFAAVLRGDNEPMTIGARSNVQDGAVLHSDPGFPLTVGDNCTIGHSAILHGCTIGNGSLIGMGATVLNGAKIGEGSLVGANALVTEGKEFPPHSLIVGAPARALRTLKPGDVEKLLQSAAHYVSNSKRFAKELKRVD